MKKLKTLKDLEIQQPLLKVNEDSLKKILKNKTLQKTYKGLETEEKQDEFRARCIQGTFGLASTEELKAEAVKLVKFYERWKGYRSRVIFIKHFFNLTEEDLK